MFKIFVWLYKVELVLKCLRICLKAGQLSPVEDLHKRAEIPFLHERRKMHTCNFVNKGIHNKLSDKVNTMFSYVNETHEVKTRANNDLAVPAVRLNISKGNVKYRGALYYNSLPPAVKKGPQL